MDSREIDNDDYDPFELFEQQQQQQGSSGSTAIIVGGDDDVAEYDHHHHHDGQQSESLVVGSYVDEDDDHEQEGSDFRDDESEIRRVVGTPGRRSCASTHCLWRSSSLPCTMAALALLFSLVALMLSIVALQQSSSSSSSSDDGGTCICVSPPGASPGTAIGEPSLSSPGADGVPGIITSSPALAPVSSSTTISPTSLSPGTNEPASSINILPAEDGAGNNGGIFARPTLLPSGSDTVPSNVPSQVPSSVPSTHPSGSPVVRPTLPAGSDTVLPSNVPSHQFPSSVPSIQPTSAPSSSPSAHPSGSPFAQTSDGTSISSPSSAQPTSIPSAWPSGLPSASPSAAPSQLASASPSAWPSGHPSAIPSASPSAAPSNSIVRRRRRRRTRAARDDDDDDDEYKKAQQPHTQRILSKEELATDTVKEGKKCVVQSITFDRNDEGNLLFLWNNRDDQRQQQSAWNNNKGMDIIHLSWITHNNKGVEQNNNNPSEKDAAEPRTLLTGHHRTQSIGLFNASAWRLSHPELYHPTVGNVLVWPGFPLSTTTTAMMTTESMVSKRSAAVVFDSTKPNLADLRQAGHGDQDEHLLHRELDKVISSTTTANHRGALLFTLLHPNVTVLELGLWDSDGQHSSSSSLQQHQQQQQQQHPSVVVESMLWDEDNDGNIVFDRYPLSALARASSNSDTTSDSSLSSSDDSSRQHRVRNTVVSTIEFPREPRKNTRKVIVPLTDSTGVAHIVLSICS